MNSPATFELSVPRIIGAPLSLTVRGGDLLIVLGANGAGKSSLMHSFFSRHQHNARRMSAHRQTWFESNALTLSPSGKRDTERNMRSGDAAHIARWTDHYSAARANIAIFDLIDAENVRARGIAGAVDKQDLELAKTLSKKDAPIKIINDLLRFSSMPIEISVKESEQVMARKSGGGEYSIAQLSDGERNALLLAANVLTVKEGTLILIDEPERHLHRSIISPLLTLLFKQRPDCAFIVSTHEVMLPIDNPGAPTLLIRACSFSGDVASAWDADLVPAESAIDAQVRRTFLANGERSYLLKVQSKV